MAGQSPSASSRFHGKLSRSSRAHSTRRSTALSSKAGSNPSGAPRRPAAWQSSTHSPAPAARNSRRNWQTGLASQRRSTSCFRRLDMRTLDKVRLRLRSLFFRPKADRELDDELRFHLDQLVEEEI